MSHNLDNLDTARAKKYLESGYLGSNQDLQLTIPHFNEVPPRGLYEAKYTSKDAAELEVIGGGNHNLIEPPFRLPSQLCYVQPNATQNNQTLLETFYSDEPRVAILGFPAESSLPFLDSKPLQPRTILQDDYLTDAYVINGTYCDGCIKLIPTTTVHTSHWTQTADHVIKDLITDLNQYDVIHHKQSVMTN